MKVITIIIFIVAFAISSMLVNKLQRLYMKLIGANTMLFNGKKKLIAIILIALVLAGTVLRIFKHDDANDDHVISEESNQEYDYNNGEIFGYEYDDNDDEIFGYEYDGSDDEIFGYEYDDNDDNISYDTYELDWEWEECSDGTVIINNYLGEDENVVIPSTLNGKPVTTVSDYAFKGNINVRSVTIPESVVSLEGHTNYLAYIEHYGTFQNCLNLEKVTFLGDLLLNGDTFQNTPYMEMIVSESADSDFIIINNNLVGINDINFGFSAKEVIIPNGVKKISRYAFLKCPYISGVVIPDSVNYIGEFAFFGCDYLEQANIPDEVTTLTEGCFGECWSLKYLELPDSIETVHEEAFSNTDLTVSYKGKEFEGLHGFQDFLQFGDDGFVIEDGCLISVRKDIDYIELPDDITSISAFAFLDCNKDMIIVYKGKRYTPLYLKTLEEDIAK